MFAERWLRRLMALLPRGATLRKEQVNKSMLAFDPQHRLFIREYYCYCVALLRDSLRRVDAPLNLIVGNYAVDFANASPTFRVDIQWEHTLVRPGGRDSQGAAGGGVPIAGTDQHYLVRLQDFAYLETLDLVIDYSQANLANLRSCDRFGGYLARTIHLAPLLYPPALQARPRPRPIISLFADTRQPRRQALLARAAAARLPLRNVKGVYSRSGLERLYGSSRILVNVHQTDDHHTFEELRVLPALLCGMLVVSEDVPLRETIAYHDYIIWSSYADLVDTVAAVHANYASHAARIFGDGRLAALFATMRLANEHAVDQAVRRLAAMAGSDPASRRDAVAPARHE